MKKKFIGYTCSYTPLPLIHAAGFTPYRIFPVTEAKDRAGSVLHENICPCVKKILDRVLDDDLPEMAGAFFMNSCESMRRLHDAWSSLRPGFPSIIADLPTSSSPVAIEYLSGEFRRVFKILCGLSGCNPSENKLMDSIDEYNKLSDEAGELGNYVNTGLYPGGRSGYQAIINEITSMDPSVGSARMKEALKICNAKSNSGGVPVYIFGNVMPMPEAYDLIGNAGLRIVGEDICTGSRQFHRFRTDSSGNIFSTMAEDTFTRPPCARTLVSERPGSLPLHVVERAIASHASGVIAHVVKFCDPYLSRLPSIRDALKQNSIPLLILEGDCTLRSLGQHRTRMEAFAEMLRGDSK